MKLKTLYKNFNECKYKLLDWGIIPITLCINKNYDLSKSDQNQPIKGQQYILSYGIFLTPYELWKRLF